MAKLIPISDNVVVEPVIEETTASGIIIPDTASKERPMKGKVVAVGPGKLLKDGGRSEMEMKEGQTVLFSKYSPNEVKVDGKDLLILTANEIYAILED